MTMPVRSGMNHYTWRDSRVATATDSSPLAKICRRRSGAPPVTHTFQAAESIQAALPLVHGQPARFIVFDGVRVIQRTCV